MSSINPHYTFQYSQPEDYRFSHDSVFLARRVFERHKEDEMASWSALDLCAGCGIVGLDFLAHCRNENVKAPARFDFLEIQETYEPHFAKNSADFPQTRFLKMNYSGLKDRSERYDLIVCNPPYFSPNEGRLSPSEFKNRCRFFLDSDFATLLEAIQKALKPTGEAYVLSRTGIKDAEGLDVERLIDVRGTGLYRLKPDLAQSRNALRESSHE